MTASQFQSSLVQMFFGQAQQLLQTFLPEPLFQLIEVNAPTCPQPAHHRFVIKVRGAQLFKFSQAFIGYRVYVLLSQQLYITG